MPWVPCMPSQQIATLDTLDPMPNIYSSIYQTDRQTDRVSCRGASLLKMYSMLSVPNA